MRSPAIFNGTRLEPALNAVEERGSGRWKLLR